MAAVQHTPDALFMILTASPYRKGSHSVADKQGVADSISMNREVEDAL